MISAKSMLGHDRVVIGKIEQDQSVRVRRRDGELVPLPHPEPFQKSGRAAGDLGRFRDGGEREGGRRPLLARARDLRPDEQIEEGRFPCAGGAGQGDHRVLGRQLRSLPRSLQDDARGGQDVVGDPPLRGVNR